jgi:hypothetical protein
LDFGISPLAAFTWVALFLWLFLCGAWAVLRPATTVRARAVAALLGALAPILCPSRGVASTFLTGLAVVFAARLPDLERERLKKSKAELFLWLFVPVLRGYPKSPEARAQNRKSARASFLEAAVTYSVWLVIAALLDFGDPPSWHWLLRSTILILYFVLTITSLEALLRGLVELSGARTDRLFEQPLLATSLRDFRQSSKTSGVRTVLIVFFWSALFHEYFAWGASGNAARPGMMLLFFLIQGAGLLVAERIALRIPRALGTTFTALWMIVTSPLFFASLHPPLIDLGYPASRLIQLRAP